MHSREDRHPGNKRDTWGRRTLFVTNPTNPAPHLKPFKPVNKDSLVATGPLWDARSPVHVTMRFALPTPLPTPPTPIPPDVGSPILPFSPLIPQVIGVGVALQITVHRGTDNLAAMTDDVYLMPCGLNNWVLDRAPFDIVTSNFLGVDAALIFPAHSTPDPNTALWVETIAVPVDMPGERDQLTGYDGATFATVDANHASVVLAPSRSARRQLTIVNTSTDADLYVMFDDTPSTTEFFVMLPKNTLARYESPVGTFTGVVWGIWVGGSPNGKALVTEGINRR